MGDGAIHKSADITYAAFRDIRHYIVAGMRERQLAWRMGRLLEKYGSQKHAFPVIVAFGEQAAEPHHVPGARQLRSGDMIKIDAGAVWHTMRGDVTRTYYFGNTPPRKFVQRYEAVYGAQQAAFPFFRAGKTGQEIDTVARAYLRNCRLHRLFIHSLGHGVGRAIHQPPWISSSARRGNRPLRIGEVITNEPGVYEPGWGGIRLEDMLEVTPRGPKWLGTAPKQLKQIIIRTD